MKIFITTHTMRLGGVERSLIGLLNAMDYTQHEVDLFLFLHDGEMLPLIPKEVNLLPQNKKYAGLISSLKDNLKQGNFDILFGKWKAKKKTKQFIQKNNIGKQNMVYDNYLQKYCLPYLPAINDKEYDLVISFLTPHYISMQKVNGKKKFAWIHTDYSFFEFDNVAELDMWKPYDVIASISDAAKEGFIKTFPELAPKVQTIENILDPTFIHHEADKIDVSSEMPPLENGVNLLSVGRYSHPKNFDNIPAIVRLLLGAGQKIKWYIIGYGSGEELIRQKIAESNVQKEVILLGKKDNPYPYMKACDIYVQPSRYEGKAVTVREAQILAKPVVITDFPTSQSQLTHDFDGYIIPLENQACAKTLKEFIQNQELHQKLIKNCKQSDFSNRSEIEKIIQFPPLEGD